jgi:hypothetical protein
MAVITVVSVTGLKRIMITLLQRLIETRSAGKTRLPTCTLPASCSTWSSATPWSMRTSPCSSRLARCRGELEEGVVERSAV